LRYLEKISSHTLSLLVYVGERELINLSLHWVLQKYNSFPSAFREKPFRFGKYTSQKGSLTIMSSISSVGFPKIAFSDAVFCDIQDFRARQIR